MTLSRSNVLCGSKVDFNQGTKATFKVNLFNSSSSFFSCIVQSVCASFMLEENYSNDKETGKKLCRYHLMNGEKNILVKVTPLLITAAFPESFPR